MKRSRSVKLALMSTVPVLICACDNTTSQAPVVYRSVENCIEAAQLTAAECKQRFNEAWSEHQQTAPHFATREQCAEQYGAEQCQESRASNGGSFFMPALMGFMVGRAMNNFGAPRVDPRRDERDNNALSARGTPLYRTRGDRDTWRTAANNPVPVQSADSLVARRGFGDSSARRSSFGG